LRRAASSCEWEKEGKVRVRMGVRARVRARLREYTRQETKLRVPDLKQVWEKYRQEASKGWGR
jgi:hypothetical protein